MNQKLKIILAVIVIIAIGGFIMYSKVTNDVVSAVPTVGEAPLEVNFIVSATDSNEDSGVYYTVVFGDESAAGFSRVPNPTLIHVYTAPGVYTAVVTRNTKCSSWECLGPWEVVETVEIVVK